MDNNYPPDVNPTDKKLIIAVGAAISKSILYVCCTIVAGMWLSTCQLSSTVIEQCEDSCGISRGIKEVTATSCECNEPVEIRTIENPYVLP